MNPPLDVLLVSQPVSYGVAIFVRQLTEAAVTAGHRVTVACPGRIVARWRDGYAAPAPSTGR